VSGDLYCAACGAEAGAVRSGATDVRRQGRLRWLAGGLGTWVVLIVATVSVGAVFGVLAIWLNWRWLTAPIVLIFAVLGSISGMKMIIRRVTGREVELVGDHMGPPFSPEEQRHIREFDSRMKKLLERRRKDDGPGE